MKNTFCAIGSPFFHVFYRGSKYFLKMWIFRIITIFIQKNVPESTLKLVKIWNCAITPPENKADT